MKNDVTSYTGLSMGHTIGLVLWPLYLALFALGSNNIYLKIGGLASLSAIITAAAAYIIGQLVDKNRGRTLLKLSAYINSLTHVTRIFIGSIFGAAVVNLSHELSETGMRMPYTKAMYDQVDRYEGQRIVYFVLMESYSCVIKVLMYSILFIAAALMSIRSVLVVAFLIAALASLAVTKERFPTLRTDPYNHN